MFNKKIDNINEVYIYLNDEFICSATNRDLGVDAMTLEEHKKAVKAYKANKVVASPKLTPTINRCCAKLV